MVCEDRGYRVRRSFYLRLKELMDALILRVVFLGIVPLNEQLMFFHFGEYREIEDAPIGIGDDGLKQSFKMT